MYRRVKLTLLILGTLAGNAAFFGAIIPSGFMFGTWWGGTWPSEFGPMELVLPAIPLGIIIGAFLIWKCEVPLRMWLSQPTRQDQENVEEYSGIQ